MHGSSDAKKEALLLLPDMGNSVSSRLCGSDTGIFRRFHIEEDVKLGSGGFGTTGFDGGATPIADCGGYGAGCPAIMINGGMAQAFQ